MLWRLIEFALFGATLFTIERTRRTVMAVGAASAAALAEVKATIATEVDQAAAKIADAVGADADTAAAIRELLTPIKGIIPDAPVDENPPVEGETGTEPGDVTPEGGIVPGEALPR